MTYIQAESSSHYYEYSNGVVTPRYEAKKADAKKFGFFPSPSTIISDTLNDKGLKSWKEGELVSASLSTEKMDGESEESHCRRIYAKSNEKRDKASNFGDRFHKAAENYPAQCDDFEIYGHFTKWVEWYEQNYSQRIEKEFFVVDDRIGIAGKCDFKGIHNSDGLVIADWKTKKMSGANITKSRFEKKWAMQGAFYTKTEARNKQQDIKFQSVIIPSDREDYPVARLWTEEELEMGYNQFLSLAYLWMSMNDYWPKGKWKPTFNL